MYIEILNTPEDDDFITYPETSFTLNVGEEFSYELPEFSHRDPPKVYIDKMNGTEDKYPPFIKFFNDTKTIVMSPDSVSYQGRTYYYTIIVLDGDSDSDDIRYVFECTVEITGELIDTTGIVEYEDITYRIESLGLDGKGILYFDK